MSKLSDSYFQNNGSTPTSIQDRLDRGEEIVWRGRPKKSSYAMSKSMQIVPIAIIWGFIDFTIIISLVSAGAFEDAPEMLLFIIPFFLLHLAPVWIAIGSLVKASNQVKDKYYYITSARFLCVESRNNQTRILDEIPMHSLTKATIHRDIFDKILKVGDIKLISDDSSFTMYDIPESEFLYDKINAIAKDNTINKELFANTVVCPYCHSNYDKKIRKCPYCGAGNMTEKFTNSH